MKQNQKIYEILNGGEIPCQIDGYEKKIDVRIIPPCKEFVVVTSILIKNKSKYKLKLDDIIGLAEDMQEYCELAQKEKDVCPFTRKKCIL